MAGAVGGGRGGGLWRRQDGGLMEHDRSHLEVLGCGYGEQARARLAPARARALELPPQLEQLLERRRLLVLRGEHLLQRRHLAGHTQGARRLLLAGYLEILT